MTQITSIKRRPLLSPPVKKAERKKAGVYGQEGQSQFKSFADWLDDLNGNVIDVEFEELWTPEQEPAFKKEDFYQFFPWLLFKGKQVNFYT